MNTDSDFKCPAFTSSTHDACAARRCSSIADPPCIVLILISVLGVAFSAAGAFHSSVWFDESYSVALAAHPLPELIRLGAADVHPVLYYVLLHLLFLITGPSIVAMRLFSVAGAAANVLLGLSVIRKDYGNTAAGIFILLLTISPWAVAEAVDIRMYSWSSFFVGLSFVYCARICRRLASSMQGAADSDCQGALPPRSWWAVAFASALAAAYTHYFGAIAAFTQMILVLALAILYARKRADHPHARTPLKLFWRATALCVIGYLPWIVIAALQAHTVSGGYWIKLKLPDLFLEILAFPLSSRDALSVLRGDMGPAAQMACAAGFLLVFAGTTALATKAYASRRHIEVELLASPVFQGVFVLLGTAALSLIAGAILGQAILVTRYLTCALVPYSLALAVLFARYKNKVVWTLCGVGLLLVSGSAQLSALTSAYSPANTQPLAYYDKATSDGQGGRVPVVSGFDLFSDIQAAGPLSVHAPNVPIAYVDSWPAYRAFEPTITFGERREDVLRDYHGRFVYLSLRYSDKELQSMAKKLNAHVIESRTFRLPYKHQTWAITTLDRP